MFLGGAKHTPGRPGSAALSWTRSSGVLPAMARDDLHGRAVADAARRLGGRVVEVDGRRGPEEIAVEVARHLDLGKAT